ncbi:MAG: hypothetical protein ABI690_00290 [Chloroflexota bacterium]
MKLYRLQIVMMIVLIGLVSGLVFAKDPTPDVASATTLNPNMENVLVPCEAGVVKPCDMIATKPEDIAGVWKQYLQGEFFSAPGEAAYIRFNADGTFNIADSIEDSAKPFKNYPTGTFKFDGQNWSTPVVLNDNVPAPCVLDTDAYQARVTMYGDQPVALRFVFISDGCAGRASDFTQSLVWVAPSE